MSRLNYEVPPGLEDAVRKLLQKDPDARYQSARELVVDLRAVSQGLERGVGPGPGSSASGLAVRARPAAPPPPTNAVAVIPFTNITREPADDWIGSGIAETVTADLKSIKGLSVIGRERVSDALRILGSNTTAALDDRMSIEVGRQLRTAWLVSGGYQRLGDLIRITARFIEVGSGAVVRTVKIDGAIGDIFSLQDKIVFELSQGMKLTLGDSEMAEIERQETESVEAYEHRSRAMMNIMEGSPQALDHAIVLLEKATRQDPNYAAAWAALALAYDFKGSFMSLRELSEKAVEVGRRATQLNPKLADAHRWLGSALLSLGRFDEAISAITEAAQLEPDDAGVTSRSRGPTGSAGVTSMRGSRSWSARSRSTRTSGTPTSSSGCCTLCVATTSRRSGRVGSRSTSRSGSCPARRGFRSWVPTHGWATSITYRTGIRRRSRSTSEEWRRSPPRTTR